MSLDGITYANKSLILKIQLCRRRGGEGKHCIYFQQYPVDSHMKILDLHLGEIKYLCFTAYIL